MTLAAGVSVGAYEIAGLVGEGGMGQVYRAHDPRLGRDVAIKVLPPAFSTDTDRLRRFEQEARAAAALSHPNILAVYDVGTHEGAPYIVSELLTGTTLRDRIGTGPLPIRRAIEAGVQITRGLAAAHEKGIVHRDLKPENLFVTDAGIVKILDFGLAKLTETTAAAADSQSTRHADTGPGVVMGTVGYMAPEQIRGLAADHRSDIFAFGAVLYELLAGERAFRGPTSADVTTAILKEDPPDLPAAERHIPIALTRIVDRCLEKAPSARFQSAGDLAFALESLSTHTSAIEPAVATSRQPRTRLAWSLAAALGATLAFVVGYGAWRLARASDAEPVATAFPLTMPDGWSLSLRTVGGSALAPLAVSPDGKHIAFVAAAADGRRGLWIRTRQAIAPRLLSGTEDAGSPFWSPDSRQLGFFAVGKLKKVDIVGGAPVAITDAPQNSTGGAWSGEGVIIFGLGGTGSGLMRVGEGGGTAVALTTLADGENSHVRPTFLPDGRHFLYRAVSGRARGPIFLGSLDSTDRTALTEADSTNVSYSSGHLLFLRDRTLMAQPFDADRLTLSGDAFPVAQSIQMFGNVSHGVFPPLPTVCSPIRQARRQQRAGSHGSTGLASRSVGSAILAATPTLGFRPTVRAWPSAAAQVEPAVRRPPTSGRSTCPRAFQRG